LFAPPATTARSASGKPEPDQAGLISPRQSSRGQAPLRGSDGRILVDRHRARAEPSGVDAREDDREV